MFLLYQHVSREGTDRVVLVMARTQSVHSNHKGGRVLGVRHLILKVLGVRHLILTHTMF